MISKQLSTLLLHIYCTLAFFFLPSDPTTVSPQSNVTEEGFLKPAGHNLTTSPTTGHSTSIPSVTWTTAVAGTDATDAHVTATAGERVTSFTSPAHSSVTSSPAAAHTEPNHSTALSPGSTVYRTTQEMAGDETRNESTLHTAYPEDIFSIRPRESVTPGDITEKYESPGATQTLKTGNGIAVDGNNFVRITHSTGKYFFLQQFRDKKCDHHLPCHSKNKKTDSTIEEKKIYIISNGLYYALLFCP